MLKTLTFIIIVIFLIAKAHAQYLIFRFPFDKISSQGVIS